LRILHPTIASVRDAMNDLRLNTPIARITELTNHLTQTYPDGLPRSVAEPLVLLLAPFAPHIAEELWGELGHPASLAKADFPDADPRYLVATTVEIPVSINGKVRSKITVAADTDAAGLQVEALADEKIKPQLVGATITKIIAIPNKMVNIVIA
jgi:leucyl-tRNA synthetase